MGRFARRVRPHLHHLRSLRLRTPPGGIVTTQRSDATTTTAAPTSGATPADPIPATGGPVGTGSRGTRILGLVTLAGIALSAYLALVSSPDDENMGDVV